MPDAVKDAAKDAGQDPDRTYHVRRQRRSAIVIVLVLLSMAGAFYYASTYFRDTAPKPGPCTTVQPQQALTPQDVSLNVYNSTNRAGLAKTVATAATDRGFKVKAVANDPKKTTVKQVAQIRYGPEGAASARLVRAHVPGGVLVNDKRKGDTVDLVVGQAWKAFGKEPVAAAPTQTLRPCPTVTVEP
ncbi:MAG: LytR C-terminal domain-containing protein [Terrabacter sp.]|nr:LytR C-terminal domain-containing protein [Dermatophilaceae bacterium]NUS41112.1 LytR C-terminal domain-containing protein [Terrabacter sp.]